MKLSEAIEKRIEDLWEEWKRYLKPKGKHRFQEQLRELAQMGMTDNLPLRVEVDGYHEFEQWQSALGSVIRRVKVKEIGFELGIAYVGRLTDPVNAAMVTLSSPQKIKKRILRRS